MCQPKKFLYGLKQSPQTWFNRFRRAACGMEYYKTNTDHTMSCRHLGGRITLLALYFDDIAITSNSEKEIA